MDVLFVDILARLRFVVSIIRSRELCSCVSGGFSGIQELETEGQAQRKAEYCGDSPYRESRKTLDES